MAPSINYLDPKYLEHIRARLLDGRVRDLGPPAVVQLIDRVIELEYANQRLQREITAWRAFSSEEARRTIDDALR